LRIKLQFATACLVIHSAVAVAAGTTPANQSKQSGVKAQENRQTEADP